MNEAENLSLLTYDQSDDQRKAESGKHIVCLDLLRAAKWTTNMENPRVAVPQSWQADQRSMMAPAWLGRGTLT